MSDTDTKCFVDSNLAACADYVGQYSKSSLRPVANYVSRPRLHQIIKKQLHDSNDDRVQEVRIVVVWGLGGAGKSQLVLNYIREHREDYAAVFWIECGSRESIERDYIQIYQLLNGRSLGLGQDMVKAKDAIPAVKSWFHGRKGRWLVVLDSADIIDNPDDPSYIDLTYILPDAPGVHIVITSRSATAKEMTLLEAVEVADLESSEAVDLFRRCAKLQDEGQDITTEVNQIVKELGYLALAITLAGSYVSVTPRLSSNIREYLLEYRQHRKVLLDHRPKQHLHRYGESVLSTWETSFDAIAHQNPAASRLLDILAFMNFDDIFMNLFVWNTSHNGESEPQSSFSQTWQSYVFLKTDIKKYELESAFQTLQAYSLVQWRSDQESYSIHKLVHAWGQDRLKAIKQEQLSDLTLKLFAEVAAEHQSNPSYQLRLVPHIMASFDILSRTWNPIGGTARDRFEIIDKTSGFLLNVGRWTEAYKTRVFHFQGMKTILGDEHPQILLSGRFLAQILDFQGKYVEAEEMHRQQLILAEKLFGEKHVDTLLSMNNLACVLRNQGKYEEAKLLLRKTINLSETLLGEKNPDSVVSMTHLAGVLNRQGNYKEAEKICRQAMILSETYLGKEHPLTLTNMNNLASILYHQKKYEEAEELLRKGSVMSQTLWGKEHPTTLKSMNILARALIPQRKFDEAEQMLQQTSTLSKTVLGNRHPDTLAIMNNLAVILLCQDKYEEAEHMCRQITILHKTVSGKEHPVTLIGMCNLASALGKQRKYDEAEEVYRQALISMETVLGKEHPLTLRCRKCQRKHRYVSST